MVEGDGSGVVQAFVDLVGVELEFLQADDLLLVGFEGQVDLAGQRPIFRSAQHYLHQVHQ